jgi:hypothetical protein
MPFTLATCLKQLAQCFAQVQVHGRSCCQQCCACHHSPIGNILMGEGYCSAIPRTWGRLPLTSDHPHAGTS